MNNLEQDFRDAEKAYNAVEAEAKELAQRFEQRKLLVSSADYSTLRFALEQKELIVAALYKRMISARGEWESATASQAAQAQREDDRQKYEEICALEKRTSDYLAAKKESLASLAREVPMLETKLYSIMQQRKQVADRISVIPKMSQPTWYDSPKLRTVAGKGIVG
jgi:hypothetical protein